MCDSSVGSSAELGPRPRFLLSSPHASLHCLLTKSACKHSTEAERNGSSVACGQRSKRDAEGACSAHFAGRPAGRQGELGVHQCVMLLRQAVGCVRRLGARLWAVTSAGRVLSICVVLLQVAPTIQQGSSQCGCLYAVTREVPTNHDMLGKDKGTEGSACLYAHTGSASRRAARAQSPAPHLAPLLAHVACALHCYCAVRVYLQYSAH